MGVFDKLFGRGPAAPEDVRKRLFDAVAAGDRRGLAHLVELHRELVKARFGEWKKVPVEFREAALLNWYGNGLIAVAETMAALGDPSLFESLRGTPSGNPLDRLGARLGEARKLAESLHYDAVWPLVEDVLIETGKLGGTGADYLRAVAFGLLGGARFHSGETARAAEPLETALALCERNGDAEGIQAYLAGLYDVRRYEGEGVAAADLADRLAAALAKSDERSSRRWGTRARIARAGEPLNRVVAAVGDDVKEIDELTDFGTARVQFRFERNRISLRPSVVHTGEACRLASQGQQEASLAEFARASAADRFDPAPHYHKGMALLELGRHAEAADSYHVTDELAPGWFYTRGYARLAEDLALGKTTVETFGAIRGLEDGGLEPREKLTRADEALGREATVPWLHLLRARALHALGRDREAQEACRRGLALEGDGCVRTRILVELAVLLPPGNERRELLDRASSDPEGNLVAAASAQLVNRAS